LKFWLLHLTRLTLPSSILSHTRGKWSMHHNCCLMFFLNIKKWPRLPWFMCLVLLKMNDVLVLLHSWITKCGIDWTTISS
jgi:hypothetical protein